MKASWSKAQLVMVEGLSLFWFAIVVSHHISEVTSSATMAPSVLALAATAAAAIALLPASTFATDSESTSDHSFFTANNNGDNNSTAAQFQLFMLNDPMAVCLDGTPAGFYWQPGSGADAYNWMIYFGK